MASLVGIVLVSSGFLLYALGKVKLGTAEKLGTPVYSSSTEGDRICVGRRLGLLERWYVAHSRSGMHLGFILALDLSTSNQASHGGPTIEDLKHILLDACNQHPWMRTKVHRDGVGSTSIDSRVELVPVSIAQKGTATATATEATDSNSNTEEASLWGDDLFLKVLDPRPTPFDQDPSAVDDFVAIREVIVPDTNGHTHNNGGDDNNNNTYDETVHSVMEQEGRTEWHDEDPAQNLWRATLIREEAAKTKEKDHAASSRFTLVLSLHHLICDGVSTMHLAKDILRSASRFYRNTPSSGESDAPSQALIDGSTGNSECVLPAPMEDLIDTIPRVSHILVPVLLDRFPSLASYLKPAHWKGNQSHQEANEMDSDVVRSCRMHRVKVVDDSTKFLDKCREYKASPNSILTSTLARAVATILLRRSSVNSSSNFVTEGGGDAGASSTEELPHIIPKKSGNEIRLKIAISADERRRRATSVRPSDMGVYVTAPNLYLQVGAGVDRGDAGMDKGPLLALAKEVSSSLKKSLKGSIMDIGLMKFISEDWIQFSNKFATTRPNGVQDSIEISNLGVTSLFDARHGDDIKDDAECAWKVEDVWFGQGRRGFGPAFHANMIGTTHNGINAVLSSFPAALPREGLVDIAEGWKQELRAFLG